MTDVESAADRGDAPVIRTGAGEPVAGPGGTAAGDLPPCPDPRRHPLRAVAWLLTLGTGLASLLLLLAMLAAFPVLNVLALGTMLEAEGRVVRSGRLRDGIPFAGLLPRIGTVVLGGWLWLLVVRLVSDAAADAALIDPAGASARGWAAARLAVTAGVGIHLIAAVFAGGGLVDFFRPIRSARRLGAALLRGTAWATAAAALADGVAAVRPGRLFSLGARGLLGGLLWLVPPTLLLSSLRDTTRPWGVVVTVVGGLLLAVVLSWVPFLQARFAADPRWHVFVDLSAVRGMWRRAPLVMGLAVVLLYGLSLPLSLFKIVAAPRDAVLLLTPIFIVTIYPARLAVGWAAHHAAGREADGWRIVRWPLGAIVMGLLLAYVFLLFFTPAIDAFGRRVLFDHHAVLLPTPM